MQSGRAIEILERQRGVIGALKKMNSSDPEFTKWRRDTEIALERIFNPGSRNISDFKRVNYSPSIATSSTKDWEWHQAYLTAYPRQMRSCNQ